MANLLDVFTNLNEIYEAMANEDNIGALDSVKQATELLAELDADNDGRDDMYNRELRAGYIVLGTALRDLGNYFASPK